MKDFAERAEIAVNKLEVGEGWRRLLPEDVIQDGDEVDVGSGVGSGEEKWVPTACPGRRVVNFPTTRYRRRVTLEVPEAVRFPAATAMANRRKDQEIAMLKDQVERLRLRPEEMDALCWCRDVMPKMFEPNAVVQIHSEVCGKMLKRLGGGE